MVLDEFLAQASERQQIKFDISRGILPFGKAIMPKMYKVDSCPLHYDLDDRLTNLHCQLTNVVAPRDTAKSSIACVTLALWHLFAEPYYRIRHGFPMRGTILEPEHSYVLIVSKTASHAQQRLRAIKQVLGDKETGRFSQEFRALYGDWGHTTATKWTDSLLLKDGSIIQAIGTAQGVHGLNEDNVRPTFVICDDPEDKENTKTIEAMVKNQNWLYESVIPGLYSGFGRLVVIGTPLNPNCMVVNLHKNWQNDPDGERDSVWYMQHLDDDPEKDCYYRSLRFNEATPGMDIMEDKWGQWQRYPGLIWPEWKPRKSMIKIKADCAKSSTLSLGYFHRQYECKIRGDSEEIFREEWFDRTWDGSLLWDAMGRAFLKIYRLGDKKYDEPLYISVGVSSGYDPAYSVERTSSFTCAANIATDAEDNRYELPWIKDRYEPAKMMEMFLQNQENIKPLRSLCEANGPQIATYDVLRAKGLYARKDSNMDKAKVERISTLQFPIENNKYWFKSGTPARNDALDYPTGSLDYLDALEKADRCRIPGEPNLEFAKKRKMRFSYSSYENAMTA